MKKLVIVYAVLIHILFFFSAIQTGFFDNFFPQGSVHQYQGIDFFQVPNGAYAWLRGGSLTGAHPSVESYAYGNSNVYHPFFTVLVGTPLQLMQPAAAFKFWLIFRLVIFAVFVNILYKNYKNNSYFPLALAFYLGLFPHYLEMWNGQYHFLLDAAIFIILLNSLKAKKAKNEIMQGLSYAFALLVKPIGVLWLPAFLTKKKFKTIVIGLGLFVLASLPFLINGSGTYFFVNLFERFKNPIGGPPGVFTLDALIRFQPLLKQYALAIKAAAAILLLFVQWKLKPNLLISLFFWTSYYLLFYDLVFEYHYTTLAPFLSLGVLTQKTFQKKIVRLLGLTFLLPTPFILFYLTQTGAEGNFVTDAGWIMMVLFRILPLIGINAAIMVQLFRQKSLSKQPAINET